MITPHGLNRLKESEGFRAKPYRCTAGKLTIGYGRNLDDVGIRESEATFLLVRDVSLAEQAISNHPIAGPIFKCLTEPRRDVLIDMTFNMGVGWVDKFESFWEAMERNAFEEAAGHGLDSKWARQVGDRAKVLMKVLASGQP